MRRRESRRNDFTVRCLMLFVLSLWLSGSHAADVFYWSGMDPKNPNADPSRGPDGTWSPGKLMIVGEIVSGDYEKMIEIYAEEKWLFSVMISSLGGDVVEAMKIGRFLRDARINIGVHKGTECVSACFLIVIGATDRYIFAPVGMHRAYFDTEYFGSLSPLEAEQRYSELDTFVREYLAEMYVPEDVIAEMMATKSTEVSYLSPEDFEARIGWTSPALQEWRIAKCGELPRKEASHIYAIQALKDTKRILEDVKEQGLMNNDQRESLELDEWGAEFASSLPAEYREALLVRHKEIQDCVELAELNYQIDVLNNLFGED